MRVFEALRALWRNWTKQRPDFYVYKADEITGELKCVGAVYDGIERPIN